VQAAMREVLQRVAAASADPSAQEGPPRTNGECNMHDSVIDRVVRAAGASVAGERVVSPIGRGGDSVPPLAHSQGQWAHGVGNIDSMLHNVDTNIATAGPKQHPTAVVTRVSASSAGYPLPPTQQAPPPQQQLKQLPAGSTTRPYMDPARRFAPASDPQQRPSQGAVATASLAAGEALDSVMQARMAQRHSERSASPRPHRSPPSVPPADTRGGGPIGSLAQQRIADAKAAQVTSSLHGTLGGAAQQKPAAPPSRGSAQPSSVPPGSTRAALDQARAQASHDMNRNTYGGVPHGHGPGGRAPASDTQLQSILRDIDGDVAEQISAAKQRLQQRRLS